MSINLGTTNAQKIELTLKVQSRDAISPMQCLISFKFWPSCDVIKAPSVQPAFVYFFLRAQPFSFNFDLDFIHDLRPCFHSDLLCCHFFASFS